MTLAWLAEFDDRERSAMSMESLMLPVELRFDAILRRIVRAQGGDNQDKPSA